MLGAFQNATVADGAFSGNKANTQRLLKRLRHKTFKVPSYLDGAARDARGVMLTANFLSIGLFDS